MNKIEKEIAENNYKILENIKEGEKFIVKDNKIEVDERWIQGIRRYITNDKRQDIIKPIELTLEYISNIKPKKVILEMIRKVRATIKKTYGGFKELEEILERYERKYKEKQYYCEIVKKFYKNNYDVVIITKEIEKERVMIDNKKRYAYIYKNYEKMESEFVEIGENIKVSDIHISPETKAKYIDYTKCIEKLEDGEYEIRYNGEKKKTLVRFEIKNKKYKEKYRKIAI